MLQFEQTIEPKSSEVVLDVGGDPRTWIIRPQLTQRVDCLNVKPSKWEESKFPTHKINTIVGDGCDLEHNDGSYDIVYSNSVIEHVGDWDAQKAFAREIMRVGKKIWIQTPAIECPIEPHFLAPFVHWLPVIVRRRALRWFSVWGWVSKPSQQTIDRTIDSIRLLSKKQVKELFSDCEIMTERLFLVFPKSYIIYRK